MRHWLKRLYSLILLFNLSLVATADEPAPLELSYLISASASEPYQMSESWKGYRGIVTEILDLVVAEEPVILNRLVLPYRRIQRGLANRELHHWVSYGSPLWTAPKIQSRSWFSATPLFRTRYQLAALRPLAQSVLNASRLNIIVIDSYRYGGHFQQWVREHGHTLVFAPSHTHALAMLRQGRGDVYLAEDVRIRWEVARAGLSLADIAVYDFHHVIPDAEVHLTADSALPAAVLQGFERKLQKLQGAR